MKATVPRDESDSSLSLRSRVRDNVEPRLLARVKLRFYHHLSSADQVLADEMVLEGWLFRGSLGLLEPIAWPPLPEVEVIVGARKVDSEGGIS